MQIIAEVLDKVSTTVDGNPSVVVIATVVTDQSNPPAAYANVKSGRLRLTADPGTAWDLYAIGERFMLSDIEQ